MRLLAAVAMVAVLLPLALAFDCPMYYEVITTPIITTVPAVATWEDCGTVMHGLFARLREFLLFKF